MQKYSKCTHKILEWKIFTIMFAFYVDLNITLKRIGTSSEFKLKELEFKNARTLSRLRTV